MNRHALGATGALLALAVRGPDVRAQDANGMTVAASEAAFRWQPAPANLPEGTQMVVLNGDPSEPGPFVLR